MNNCCRILCLIIVAIPWFQLASQGDDLDASLRSALERVQAENRRLESELADQRRLLAELTKRMEAIETEADAVVSDEATPGPGEALFVLPDAAGQSNTPGYQLGSNVHLSGEGAMALFYHGSDGMFPGAEFRMDEVRLFLESQVHQDGFVFAEINITERESGNEDLRVGEVYLEWENVLRPFGRDNWLNLRFGRLDIPFGEEYMSRDAIDNPLISHSLADLWGVDEGIEAYGRLAEVAYVLAVQNGGHPSLRDFNGDKSVTLRASYSPLPWLRSSLSLMRTGDLDAESDRFSELWFGNGFVQQLTKSSTTFSAELVQLDLHASWSRGWIHAAGGILGYDDDDPAGNNERDVWFYHVEWVQDLTRKLYGAARFSQVIANEGFPVRGDRRAFGGPLTKDLWRLSVGVGYRMNPNLVFKAEYAFNRGQYTNGSRRDEEDMIAAEVAFQF